MNHHPGAIQEECMAKMELNRQEEYLNRIDRLKLMDDDFFSEALDGKVEAVEFILQVVLEKIVDSVSYTHLRAHETDSYLVCRLLLEKKKYTSPIPRDRQTSRMPSSALKKNTSM